MIWTSLFIVLVVPNRTAQLSMVYSINTDHTFPQEQSYLGLQSTQLVKTCMSVSRMWVVVVGQWCWVTFSARASYYSRTPLEP